MKKIITVFLFSLFTVAVAAPQSPPQKQPPVQKVSPEVKKPKKQKKATKVKKKKTKQPLPKKT